MDKIALIVMGLWGLDLVAYCIAKLTPTDKDDHWVAKATSWLQKAASLGIKPLFDKLSDVK